MLIQNTTSIAKNSLQEVENTIFNYRNKELFFNLSESDIPPIGHPERDAFIDWEEEKCIVGVNINGIYIPGTYYYDICHFAIPIDMKDKFGTNITRPSRPKIRDNDWLIHEALYQAELEKKNLVLGTARQLSKSKNIASIFTRDLQLFDFRRNMLMAGSEKDLTPIKEYILYGNQYSSSFFRLPVVTQDKRAETIEFGFKTAQGENIIKSTLYLRNTRLGANTEVSAGWWGHRAAYDEIAKFPFRSSYEAVKPTLVGENGIRSSSILAFTGGDAEKSQNAEELFLNPEGGNFLAFNNENKKTGFYLGGIYRQDLKKETNLWEWEKLKEHHIPEDSELYNLKIRVADKERGEEILDKEEETAKRSKDPSALTKQKMYNPRCIADMFKTEGVNPFTHLFDGMRKHKDFLIENCVGIPIELSRDPYGKLNYTYSKKSIIHSYPTPSDANLDAPIVMYDLPKYQDHYSLHILDSDPYNDSETKHSDSLGAVYVMRRMHSDMNDPFRGVMVASYCARPPGANGIRTWLKNVELLREFYNCEMLFENTGNPFKSYFEGINQYHYLMKSLPLTRKMNPNTDQMGEVGVKATRPNHIFQISMLKRYLEEELQDGKMGYTRIQDPVLIDEIIAYNGMGDGTRNVDRMDAFLIQCSHLYHYEQYGVVVTNDMKKDPEKKKVAKYQDAFGFGGNNSFVSNNAFGF